jgi:Na+/alanine symporter
MPFQQKVFFLSVAAGFLLLVLELVRRRRLRVEYASLWIASGLGLFVVILRYDVLIWLTDVSGAVLPTSTVFFLATLFLGLLAVHYSIQLTTLGREVKELAQELALLRAELQESRPTERE